MHYLRKWLKIQFRLDPENLGDIMIHGTQTDTFNCGPAAASTISHHTLGTDLWTPERAVLERVQWFLKICDHDDLCCDSESLMKVDSCYCKPHVNHSYNLTSSVKVPD